jgi:hypothetical protein
MQIKWNLNLAKLMAIRIVDMIDASLLNSLFLPVAINHRGADIDDVPPGNTPRLLTPWPSLQNAVVGNDTVLNDRADLGTLPSDDLSWIPLSVFDK